VDINFINVIFFFLLVVTLTFILCENRLYLAKKFGLFDYPNKIKLHNVKTPKVGGLILICISILVLLFFLLQKNFFETKILLFGILCSIIGLIDDKYNLSPYKKIFFLSLIVLFFLLLNQDFLIQKVVFSNFLFKREYFLNVKFLSIFFTTFCILLLVNAYNMTDGHNGIAIMIGIVWFIFFWNIKLFVFLTFILAIILIYNLKSKIFLGDSGNYFISTLIALSVIDFSNKSFILSEQIFILFILIGIDMLRVFIERVFKNKNPFLGDRNHLHQLLKNRFNSYYTIAFYILLFLLPIIMSIYSTFDKFLIILLFTFLYFLVLISLKKKIKK